jgi:hypothetical protein
MILMVVLALLTLFAIVGLSFVLYSDAAALSARTRREAETPARPEIDPEQALALFLGQLIYDVRDDETGVGSGLRGHSLARTLYGYNTSVDRNTGAYTLLGNDVPYSGVGRLHSPPYPATAPRAIQGADDYTLVNYTYFARDGFLRDPERYNPGTGAQQGLHYRMMPPGLRQPGQPDNRQFWVGGFHAPYTYPDLNSFFLAAVQADGTVLARSFHRDWLFNNGLPFNDVTTGGVNNNWLSGVGKYKTPRPRPVDHLTQAQVTARGLPWPLVPEDLTPVQLGNLQTLITELQASGRLFPYPEDVGGDVKNLPGSPGFVTDPNPAAPRFANNDSIWVDIGAPVMTAPDGRKFKMLVAPLITDLDGLINLNVAGNVSSGPNTMPPYEHRSNQGWGPWEINLSKILNADATSTTPPQEWKNLFLGNPPPPPPAVPARVWGRYGPDRAPNNLGGSAPSGRLAHVYAQSDIDGRNENTGGVTGQFTLPGGTLPGGGVYPGTSCFPSFTGQGSAPIGYGNGSTGANGELTNHPARYNVFRSPAFIAGNDDRVFAASNMEALLRANDTGSPALTSELLRLCPVNFANPTDPVRSARRRRLVTTHSSDLARPGLSPWWWNGAGTTNDYSSSNGLTRAPVGSAASFPPLNYRRTPPIAVRTPPREFGDDWRAVTAALGRIDLNRVLPPYPHQGQGGNGVRAADGMTVLPLSTIPLLNTPQNVRQGPYGRFDDASNPVVVNQFKAALAARQQFADDIYRRLLAVTGVVPIPAGTNPGQQGNPSDAQLAPRRWLAQLAVNIVDYIDEDDISTPFNFYNTADGLPANRIGTLTNSDQELPKYWVFGTERPHVVVNEVLAEHPDASVPGTGHGTTPRNVKVWVELYNTLPGTLPAGPLQQLDRYAIPFRIPAIGQSVSSTTAAYSTYKLVISNGLLDRTMQNDNVLGKPASFTPTGAPGPRLPREEDFTHSTTSFPGTTQQPAIVNPQTLAGYPYIEASKYFLVAPPTFNDPTHYRDPVTTTAVPPTPLMRSPVMDYTADFPNGADPAHDERDTGIAVILRRLANPHLPPDLNPVIAGSGQPNPWYNPYITVDYIEKAPLRYSPPPAGTYASRAKTQPYGAGTTVGTNWPAIYTPPGANSPVRDETGTGANGARHSFGGTNNPRPSGGNNSWLVHLDRQLISPTELLHVSGYQPHQLTQQFGQPLPSTTRYTGLPHYVDWFDNNSPANRSNRLFRLFESLECSSHAAGVQPGGRIPGKVNINTIYDYETFLALCDRQSSNRFTDLQVYNTLGTGTGQDNPTSPSSIYWRLMQLRKGGPPYDLRNGIAPAANDRPFLGMGTGFTMGADTVSNNPRGRGMDDTLFRQYVVPGSTPVITPLFQVQGAHPYLQWELLTKIYNNVTCRSNVFAVWLTVGFFEVTDASTQPPTLGAEIGRAEGRNVRHRMFAVVDRTNLQAFSTTTDVAISVNDTPLNAGQPQGPGLVQFPISATVQRSADGSQWTGTVANSGHTWVVQGGSVLVYEPNTDNEESVVVVDTGNLDPTQRLQATFRKNHPRGAVVIRRGTPGPWLRYDPRQDTDVVPYFSIID